MSNDISKMLGKKNHIECGEHYIFSKKEENVSPKQYGEYLAERKRRRRKK